MAARVREPLLNSFAEVRGGEDGALHTLLESTALLTDSMGTTAKSQASGPNALLGETVNAAAGVYGSSANTAGSNVQGLPLESGEAGGAGSTAESVVSTFFESGFGMAALVKGLMGLFGGGTPTQPLEKYEMPPPIDFESAETGAGLSAGSYDQTGAMRAAGTGGDSGIAGGTGSAGSPQITVNVQTMDSQSFLDHSEEIAQAVRGAMLSMSSINDVVNEL
jgi:hypothetical protein